MSTASRTQAHHASPLQTVMAVLGDIKTRIAQRRSYHQTVNALSQLSDHELSDLGLSRGSVHSDAWQAVYGTRHRG